MTTYFYYLHALSLSFGIALAIANITLLRSSLRSSYSNWRLVLANIIGLTLTLTLIMNHASALIRG